jgi:translation initiation factor IF-3
MAIKIKKRYQKRQLPKELVNERIRFPNVLVIDDTGTNIGKVNTREAIEMAREKGLDLICINEGKGGETPVTKMQDYGKFKYERSKKEKETKKKQVVVENKEIRLTVNIGQHDLEVKAKKAREFLEDGNRVKVSLKFRGREMQHKEIGHETIMNFFKLVEDVSTIDKKPAFNTRFLDMYLAPVKRK